MHILSHTCDFPPGCEQLWNKSISHGFYDLQLCAVYLAWLTPLEVKYARKCILYGFPCEMDSSPLLSESHPRRKMHIVFDVMTAHALINAHLQDITRYFDIVPTYQSVSQCVQSLDLSCALWKSLNFRA